MIRVKKGKIVEDELEHRMQVEGLRCELAAQMRGRQSPPEEGPRTTEMKAVTNRIPCPPVEEEFSLKRLTSSLFCFCR